MQTYPEITRRRLKQFSNDHNLGGLIYPESHPVDLSVFHALGRVSYDDALQGEYIPTTPGIKYGPLFSTHWFRVTCRIPEEWAGCEIHFLWVSNSEACVWQYGVPVQGLAEGGPRTDKPSHKAFRLTANADGGEVIEFMVEMAANGLFGAGEGADDPKLGLLEQAEIAVFDREAWDLLWDYSVIADMALALPPDSPQAGRAIKTANTMVNTIKLADRETWPQAREIAAEFFTGKNGDTGHTITAIGHAHIDTAWLWPIEETIRKCTRSFSTAVRYMDDYPEYKFAVSQAQQYAWMKEHQPALYRKIQEKVSSGQFIPVGGTWVEPDTNIPSGESLVRQFLYGRKFFKEEFGLRCKEFWLPDTFGYSAALPQIMRGAGISNFMSQKLSWNQFNKPAHSTFIWEGLDGSEVLVHFPPVDTYNAMVTAEEILFSVANFKDHDRSDRSLLPFGFGDGGGGPTMAMLERLRRFSGLDGMPTIEIGRPDDFFDAISEDEDALTRWVGELYFEMHRGTYTSQAANKRDNRRSEEVLHDAEYLNALAFLGGLPYPHEELDRLWKLLLLNQFHDILPGTSITEVYETCAEQYTDILESGEALVLAGADALYPAPVGEDLLVINPSSVPRHEVAELDDGNLAMIEAPAYSASLIEADLIGRHVDDPVSVAEREDGFLLENAFLRVEIARSGHVTSLIDKTTGRECLAPGAKGNQFVIFDDRPLAWDAWDVEAYHLEKRTDVEGAFEATIIESSPLRAGIWFETSLSDSSSLRQEISLDALSRRLDFSTDVDWHESQKFLKVEFPLNLRAEKATYDIQYGMVERPTHFNTSWDMARFEVSAHHWADLHEPDFGVALLNDCKYGYAVHGNVMRLSLLRAPIAPDPIADRGLHHFRYALLPHAMPLHASDVVAEGIRFNQKPLLRRVNAAEMESISEPFFAVDAKALILDTVKKAEDEDAIILRLYEAYGTRGQAKLKVNFPFKAAYAPDLMEEGETPLEWDEDGITLDYRPYGLVTVKITPGSA